MEAAVRHAALFVRLLLFHFHCYVRCRSRKLLEEREKREKER